ncbi:drug resistance MFS transporter, drug:H+ antiporter-2 (14 Spanner) (DHA2) family [Agrobacterium rosae]|uniref:Drug resistance MFS transporter, drug:H+ antiporter-2 (14 Spanner) (DHA2) family n=3 Tax=Agrobacterium rosae TaxID=1972867 RepID=A0A1R3TZM4_9HYPH|nr:drug resistance MFS transporter, drug:H+ antiporter-2 (14 Spanner) (DHA2) family [Agrobacterium rosae]
MSDAVSDSQDMPDKVEAEVETPAAPVAPPEKTVFMKLVYIVSGLCFFVTQGMGMNIVMANIYQLQGEFSATIAEVAWLSAAYMAPYATFSIALFKVRQQYGLRPFAEISIICFVLASCLNLFVTDLHSAIVVRFVSGMAAAPLSSLGFLYILEAFPVQRKLTLGLSIALTGTLLSAPLARIISPELLDIDGWQALYTMEVGLSLAVLPIIYLLPLTPPPRAKVIERMDILSYLLFAGGLGCLAVFLTLGRFYWWFETWWLGVLLATSIGLLALMTAIELPRKNPMLDLRWIFSRTNLHLIAILLIYRAVSSEQSSTAVSLYQQLGILNEQTTGLYALIIVATLLGGALCALLMLTKYVDTAHVIALALIALGAFMDSGLTNLVRPEQMYLSQAMIAFGAAMFLPPVMAKGFGAALAKGPPYLVNFITIFIFTQITGSLLTTGLLGSFVTLREKFHSNILVESILLQNPQVAQRVSQLSAGYSHVITDAALLKAEGLSLLGAQVTREAYILAYNDTFLLISVCAAAALVMLLLHLAWLRLKSLLKSEDETVAAPQS